MFITHGLEGKEMRGIAKSAVARILALAAVFMFALCVCIGVIGTQSAYAEQGEWNAAHTHYYKGGDIMVTDGFYYVEQDKGWYYFDEYGFTEKGWIKLNWDDEIAYWYGDPAKYGMLKLGWQKIGGHWYYFAKESGISQDNKKSYGVGMMYDHGTAKVNGKWYYFGTSDDSKKWGKMQYGWIGVIDDYGDKVWYYADSNKDGQLALGWNKVGGKWYYFEPNDPGASYNENWYPLGVMHYGHIETIKGYDYYFAKGGAMQSGWIKESYRSATWDDGSYQVYTDWYYADPSNDSRLVTGWKKISGYWYYFGGDHEMYDNNTWTINGKLYIFDRSGKLPNKEGWVNLYEEYFYEDGSESQAVPYWVYSNKSGIATVGWKKVSGYWYFFDEWGYMEYDAWVEDSKGVCYLQTNGKMATSKWVKYGNNWYYVDASGHRVSGDYTINGKVYHFDSNGIWLG